MSPVGFLLYRTRALLAGVLLCLAPFAAASELVILTGGTSGVYYPVGQKLKVLLDEAIPEHRFRVVSTQASVENLNLLQRGAGVLALAQGDTLADAWAGRRRASRPRGTRSGCWGRPTRISSTCWRERMPAFQQSRT